MERGRSDALIILPLRVDIAMEVVIFRKRCIANSGFPKKSKIIGLQFVTGFGFPAFSQLVKVVKSPGELLVAVEHTPSLRQGRTRLSINFALVAITHHACIESAIRSPLSACICPLLFMHASNNLTIKL
jgi:hypothetical protein